jgi:hypothetical protein
MMRSFVDKKTREQARMVARASFVKTSERFVHKSESSSEIKRIALQDIRSKLLSQRRFKSIFGSILLMIVMKIIERLIEKWINENLWTYDQISPDYQKDEPGYAS